MSNGYVSHTKARPTHSGVYAVRYIARAMHDPDDLGHECEAFAYWDNGLKRWARACLGVNIALGDRVKKTAQFFYHTRQDLDWKAI